jgi:hypothetical protein
MTHSDGQYFARESIRVQRERAHIFHQKLNRRVGARDARPTHDAAELDVNTFASVYSAADFASASGLSLDMLVTLDFARMGIDAPADVQREVTRFVKCYHAWAEDRYLPVAWIYAIETGRSAAGWGYHAHVALFVPGQPEDPRWPPLDCDLRRQFKEWARGYSQRRFGEHIPRAVWARGGSKESQFRHWMAVSYLVKGFNRTALVQSGRSSPDDRPVYLGDVLPWPYCNPGPVDLPQRIKVSHSLGPKRREFGAPTGMDYLLPRRPNWDVFQVSRIQPLTLKEELETQWTLPKARPFRSRWEDGVRDVRELYPVDFYRYVTRQEPYEAMQATSGDAECLSCQLRAMAE